MGLNGRQVIDLFKMKTSVLRVQQGYHFVGRGRFAKLQRKLWNYAVVKGILMPHMVEEETVQRIVIDGGELFDRIFEQYGDVISRRDPQMVIMGPNTWGELMRRRDLHGYTGDPIDMTATAEKVSSTGRRQMFALPVKVVPEMEGCVIL